MKMKRTSTSNNLRSDHSPVSPVSLESTMIETERIRSISNDSISSTDTDNDITNFAINVGYSCRTNYYTIETVSNTNVMITLGEEYILPNYGNSIKQQRVRTSMSLRRLTVCKKFAVENSLPLDVVLDKVLT